MVAGLFVSGFDGIGIMKWAKRGQGDDVMVPHQHPTTLVAAANRMTFLDVNCQLPGFGLGLTICVCPLIHLEGLQEPATTVALRCSKSILTRR